MITEKESAEDRRERVTDDATHAHTMHILYGEFE